MQHLTETTRPKQSLNNRRMIDIILITHPHRDHLIRENEQGQIPSRERREQSILSLVCQSWHEKQICHTGISHRKQTNNSVLSPSSQQMGTVRNTQSSAFCKKKWYMTTWVLNALPRLPNQTLGKNIPRDVFSILKTHTFGAVSFL